jgi:hypothetical protein
MFLSALLYKREPSFAVDLPLLILSTKVRAKPFTPEVPEVPFVPSPNSTPPGALIL